jgi:hypothetical protein
VTYVPLPSEACPRTGECFYCRAYLRCPLHAGEPIDYLGYLVASMRPPRPKIVQK